MNWRGDEFLRMAEAARDTTLLEVAKSTAEHGQQNAVDLDVLDTSFLSQSFYHNSQAGSSYGDTPASGKYYSFKAKGMVQRSKAPERGLPGPDYSLAGNAAVYFIFQEVQRSMLYLGLTQTAQEVGAILKRAWGKHAS